VSWKSVVDVTGADYDGYGAYLENLGSLIQEGLGHAEWKVREKYLWLHTQYVAAIDVVAALPAENAFRLENPEMSEGIQSLPRFQAEVAAAMAMIQQGKAAEAAKR
jgi:hypothetical protein